MLKTSLLHPQILGAIGRAGHGSQILISDGNFPHKTKSGPNSELVFLNFAPGQMKATEVLAGLMKVVPLERAEVIDPARTGPYGMKSDPPIFDEFRTILQAGGANFDIGRLERFAFYDAASTKDVCLTIATGEQRLYGCILLTIGVVMPA